jgi:hypothetical protein
MPLPLVSAPTPPALVMHNNELPTAVHPELLIYPRSGVERPAR